MNRPIRWLVFYFLFGLLLRFFTLQISVIDHDESTYLVIAKALSEGGIYWVDIFDTKPIGIFLLYGFFMKFLGIEGMVFFRILGTFFLAGTAFFIHRLIEGQGQNYKPALFGGLAYLLMNSTFTFYGISPNTETYYTFFTAVAAFWILTGKANIRFFLSGLMLGIGFVIKYVVVFDMVSLGLIVLLMSPLSFKNRFKKIGWLAIGSVLPFLGVAMWYYFSDYWDTFYFHTFEVSGRYPKSAAIWEYPVQLIDFFGRFFVVSIVAVLYWVRRVYQNNHWNLQYWLLFAIISALLPGKFFGHYFIQAMLPLCLMFGLVLSKEEPFLRKRMGRFYSFKTGILVFGFWALIAVFFQKKDYWDKPDFTRDVANYLAEQINDEEEIYTGNSSQIIYYLLGKSSPIPYVHPSLFWQRQHIDAMEIPVKTIIDHVKQLSPKYVLMKPLSEKETVSHTNLLEWVDDYYVLDTVIGDNGQYLVYQLSRED